MQNNFEYHWDNHCVEETEPSGEPACLKTRQPAFLEISEYATRSQSKQGDGNCQKCEVIKEHDREKPGQAQLQ